MKKLSVLIATALLSTAPVTYADELDDLLDSLGLDRSVLENLPPETGGEMPEEIQGIIWTIPEEIFWDNSTPVYGMQLCGVEPVRMDDPDLYPFDKRVMGKFKVTAHFLGQPSQAVDFIPDIPDGGGVATGAGWRLKQLGTETWDQPWKIEIDDPSLIMTSIEMDLLSERKVTPRTKYVFAAFDILLRPNDKITPYNLGVHDNNGVVVAIGLHDHPSPGSGAGWPIDEKPPFVSEGISLADYTATFYDPIVLEPSILKDPHDLYGRVIIDFVIDNENGVVVQNGIQGNANINNLAFAFWQDTDCLPINDFGVSESADGMGYDWQATGPDMNLYLMSGSTRIMPLGSSGPDGATIAGTVMKADLEAGQCYEVVDINDDGSTFTLYKGCH